MAILLRVTDFGETKLGTRAVKEFSVFILLNVVVLCENNQMKFSLVLNFWLLFQRRIQNDTNDF